MQIGPARKISAVNFARVADTVGVQDLICATYKKGEKKIALTEIYCQGATFMFSDFKFWSHVLEFPVGSAAVSESY